MVESIVASGVLCFFPFLALNGGELNEIYRPRFVRQRKRAGVFQISWVESDERNIQVRLRKSKFMSEVIEGESNPDLSRIILYDKR